MLEISASIVVAFITCGRFWCASLRTKRRKLEEGPHTTFIPIPLRKGATDNCTTSLKAMSKNINSTNCQLGTQNVGITQSLNSLTHLDSDRDPNNMHHICSHSFWDKT